MPRKGQRGAPRPLGASTDPQGFAVLATAYLDALRVRNYSEATIASREHHLREFIRWAEERGLTRPSEVTKPTLERYQRFLFHYRKKNGQPLSFRSQHGCLVPVRALFKWLCRQNHLLANPAADLDLPRAEKRLPRHVLTAAEAEHVLALPNIADPLGLRDRAILETLYSTGMRRMELIGLKLYDLDQERGTIFVRQGKGKKDRMIPMGERAFAWVRRYLEEARPQLALTPDDGIVFLTNVGLAFEANRLTQLVRDYVDRADIGKKGSCHLFRHTCATLMLENGADIRFIQQLLGHEKLETTQIYAQVSIRMLKEVHTRTHPARLTAEAPTTAAVIDAEADDELAAELAAEAAEDEA
ncbi:MAG: site-specific tyrosine recombinase XerC [Verrucomicrobia bacterium]|nr:site-specific tyrosine recombinase XerC [Verrucomicrobiota bacterium]